MIGIYPNVAMNRVQQKKVSFKSNEQQSQNDIYADMLKLEQDLDSQKNAESKNRENAYNILFDQLKNAGMFQKKKREDLVENIKDTFKSWESAIGMNDQLKKTVFEQKEIIEQKDLRIKEQNEALAQKDDIIKDLNTQIQKQSKKIEAYEKSEKPNMVEDENVGSVRLTNVGLSQYTELVTKKAKSMANIKILDDKISAQQNHLERLRKNCYEYANDVLNAVKKLQELQDEKGKCMQETAQADAMIKLLQSLGELPEEK